MPELMGFFLDAEKLATPYVNALCHKVAGDFWTEREYYDPEGWRKKVVEVANES